VVVQERLVSQRGPLADTDMITVSLVLRELVPCIRWQSYGTHKFGYINLMLLKKREVTKYLLVVISLIIINEIFNIEHKIKCVFSNIMLKINNVYK